VNKPAIRFYFSSHENLFHYLNDALLLVLDTLNDTGLTPPAVQRRVCICEAFRTSRLQMSVSWKVECPQDLRQGSGQGWDHRRGLPTGPGHTDVPPGVQFHGSHHAAACGRRTHAQGRQVDAVARLALTQIPTRISAPPQSPTCKPRHHGVLVMDAVPRSLTLTLVLSLTPGTGSSARPRAWL